MSADLGEYADDPRISDATDEFVIVLIDGSIVADDVRHVGASIIVGCWLAYPIGYRSSRGFGPYPDAAGAVRHILGEPQTRSGHQA